MTYKWETLKRKALETAVGNWDGFFHRLAPYGLIGGIADGTFDWKANANELADRVADIIRRWDVRGAQALSDLFPGLVQKRFVGRTPRCFIADNKNYDWMVEFSE